MGNSIASLFVQSLRRSLSGTTVYSQTSANPPLFTDPTTLNGVARAWVSFSGLHRSGQRCTIFNKSTTVVGVTSRGLGDYEIEFTNNAFTNNEYIVVGSVRSRETVDLLSAANHFFVMDVGTPRTPIVSLTNKNFRIQTVYTTASAGALYSGPAWAHKVNLVIYK